MALNDFGIEYAKSARATCCACQIKISKAELRIKKTVFDTEVGMKFGGQALWHHVECFAKIRDDLGFFASGDQLPGFKQLENEDKQAVKDALPAVKATDMPETKKIKLEKKEDEEAQKENSLFKAQNEQFFKYKTQLEAKLSKKEMATVLEHNQLKVPEGKERILNLLSDILTFGSLQPCPECGGQFRFDNKGYICTGDTTEWSKCVNRAKEPKRVPTKIPLDISEDHKFLAKYKCKVQHRFIPYYQQSVDSLRVKKEEEDGVDGPKVQREKPKLYNMEFLLLGKLKRSRDEIKKIIQKAGGKVTTKLHDKVMAVIAPKSMVDQMTDKMEMAQTMNIQVVSEQFLDEFMSVDPIHYIQTQSICDWGGDPRLRVAVEDTKSRSKSIYEKSVPKSMTLKLKDGSAVDPDSGLDDVAHVYQEKGVRYNSVLAITDIQSGKNSFYKLQLLQGDTGNKYWVFRAWGRIGTTIGGNKVEKFSSLYEAKDSFEEQYLDKTGNCWEDREHFVKVPKKYYPLDIDYGEDEQVKSLSEHCDIPSKLDTRVQNLIKLIFDINAMKKVMLEFELDMEKMPLGKLSQRQIKSAYGVLTELSDLITKNGTNSKFVDASNRFYTLIPHNFGVSLPPILDTLEQVRNKMNMLETLLEIEVAYNMLSVPGEAKDSGAETNPIDLHYNQLKTDLVPVEKTDPEYEYLMQYVKNTHAETHNQYELDVETIYKVKRSGEAKRYKPFKKLHNRRLLWHGSRLTNYVGILSHGLKIAPPEAPSTGYMFGKGVYFADMVSKSANYCATSTTNSTGLMLLCEVALGDMMEYTAAEYVTKLPKDKHSTWGKGKTYPNPAESLTLDDGVTVPYGKAVKDQGLKSSLLYNEFIVYDAAQVNVQYLFKMNFKYKY